MKYILIALAGVLLSCQPKTESDHAHDANGNHISVSGEVPRLDYTIWTDKTELFVEFPALVVGAESRFAAHFTVLNAHQAVLNAQVTVRLENANDVVKQTVGAPASPGIFTPALKPTKSGNYQLVFEINSENFSDRIVIENIEVFANVQAAIQALSSSEEENGITFLKEQAWKMDFQTKKAELKDIYETIPTSGIWRTAPGDIQTTLASTSGKVNYHKSDLMIGSEVRKGELLVTISGEGLSAYNLNAEIEKAKAIYKQTRAEFLRKSELFEKGVISKAELEKSERENAVAKENYSKLSGGVSQRGKQVFAQMNGYVKSIEKRNGAFVNEGDELFTITDAESSILEINVGLQHAHELKDIQNIVYKTEQDEWSDLTHNQGEILSVGKTVSPDKPSLAVFAKIKGGTTMPEGSYTEAFLEVGDVQKGIVIPLSALLEDYGNYSVVVQLSGELFELRNVEVGRRSGSEVEILSGLKEGEVVVTDGAFQVKMASMSGQAPAHGHAH